VLCKLWWPLLRLEVKIKGRFSPPVYLLPTATSFPSTLDTCLSIYYTTTFSHHLVSPSRGQPLEKSTSISCKRPRLLVRAPAPLQIGTSCTQHAVVCFYLNTHRGNPLHLRITIACIPFPLHGHNFVFICKLITRRS
jgi:hypothetical protein